MLNPCDGRWERGNSLSVLVYLRGSGMRNRVALFLVVACGSHFVCAETSAPVAEPAGTRLLSGKLSSELRAGLPSYHALERPPVIAPSAAASDSRVLVLPKLEVSGARVLPDSRALTSKQGMEMFLRKRYRGASFKGQDPYHSHMANYAALQYQDDERVRQRKSFEVISESATPDDPLREIMDDAFLRRASWLEDAMDRSYNHDRR